MAYTSLELTQKINSYIETVSFDEKPASLFEPISYILSLGGKRLRPLLTLLGANLFSGNIEQAMKPAIGMEIFHNFSLLHDDLMDKSDMRRGKPTVHKKWNDNAAILSGDAMLIESYNYVTSVSAHLLSEVLSLFSKTAMEVCQGQQFDMEFESREDVTESEYLEMIRLKTAVLLACSLKLGAVLGGASASDADFLYNYGINIGLAFQIKDDLLDVYGDPKTFGKNIGGDIVNNKKTYLLIKALKMADEKQMKELKKWLLAEKFDKKEKISAVENIYNELNIKTISENLVEKYYLAALDSLSSIKVSDERKTALISLAEDLMHREL